jgi:hypothetical protein
VATALAQGSRRTLEGPLVRARIALSLELPLGAAAQVDALALALVARPGLVDEWLIHPSTGSLTARRLAGRLLERAAREAVRLAALGDDAGIAALDEPAVKAARARLIQDRESLAWRHVASAHGLLAHRMPDLAEDLARGLDLSRPNEWRKSAAALAAGIAIDPDRGVARCRSVPTARCSSAIPGWPAR